MYIQYGTFQFAPGEATFAGINMRTNQTSRGYNISQQIDFSVIGEVCKPTQAEITSRISQITNAFSQHGYDIGLYHDDGTPTPHFLQSSHQLNLTGNQVKTIRFPEVTGGEYVDGRKFAITVGAEVLGAERQLLSYYDSIEQVGNGQPDIRWRLIPNIGWAARLFAPSTLVRYFHSGSAETLDTWLTPPPPYFPGPPFLVPGSYRVRRHHPVRRPQGFLGYRVDWFYEYNLLIPTPGYPTVR